MEANEADEIPGVAAEIADEETSGETEEADEIPGVAAEIADEETFGEACIKVSPHILVSYYYMAMIQDSYVFAPRFSVAFLSQKTPRGALVLCTGAHEVFLLLKQHAPHAGGTLLK